MWGLDFHHNMESVVDQLGKYSTEIFTDQAVKIISKHNNSEVCILLFNLCLILLSGHNKSIKKSICNFFLLNN